MPLPGVKPSELKAAERKFAPPARALPGLKPSLARENRVNRLMRPASQQPERQTWQEKLVQGLPAGKETPFKVTSALRERGQRERASRKAQGGGLSLASIAGLPAAALARGYQNLATATGIKPLGEVGKLAAETVNIPAQVLPAAYHFGHAVGEKIEGKPQELHELGKQFAKESAVAHLVKGDFAGAAKAAGEHPIGTGLEVTGVGSAADRALGSIGRLSGVQAAKLADRGATTTSRAPREYPPEAIPKGGATVAQRPYHKGLVRPLLEKKLAPKPIPTGRVSAKLRQAYDRFQGEHLAITRRTRDLIAKHHAQTVKGTPQAITSFGQWLADPKVINPETKVPFAQEHLQEAIEHFKQAPPGEFPEEAKIREANVKHLEGLRGKDLTKAYTAAQKIAADKRALEPELVRHQVYTPETIRAAKVIPAFRFQFRDQNPFVDTSVPVGESPFRLGGPEGKQIPVDEVYRQLEAKGIHEKQLSFVSTRPFQNGNAPFRTGYTPGGAKVAKGHLTGQAFMRGQFDPTHDAALRQHLTDASIINKARGDLRFAREYIHPREAIAKLLEARIDRLPAEQQTTLRNYIASELRSGPGIHFEAKGGKSPWQRSLEAQEHLRALYPDIQLEPVRVAHQYATGEYRRGLGKHLDLGAAQDMLDPENHGPEHEFWKTRVPEEGAAQHDVTAGPVGLVHREIRDRVRRYEKDLGQAHLSRMPSSFWRKTNVAFSVRHVPGVVQEVGLRMLANNVGLLSGIRGTRAASEMIRYGQAHPDPFVKLGAQRVEAVTGGTVASQALEQMRHVTRGQLADTKLAKAADWWNRGEAHRITGSPLRAVRGAIKTFNGTTNAILKFERKTIEHPPQVAGLGKHWNEEFRALHGQRLKLIGAFSDVEKAFLRGRLDPKAIDHAANLGREYWGEWTRSSPEFKNYQRVSPFLQWYLNSLRFIYHTMPVHHPIKTGLLTAIEGATREQRLAEGQEYKGGFPLGSHLLPTDLEPSQQGSLPFGKERAGQEYYTPTGAISAGPLESLLQANLPYASGIWMVAHGINPLTNKPLEEKLEGKKQPIKDANQLALLAALSAGESFLPPLRYAESLSKKSVGHVFRPLRTEKTRTEEGKKAKASGGVGGSIGGGLGSVGGGLP